MEENMMRYGVMGDEKPRLKPWPFFSNTVVIYILIHTDNYLPTITLTISTVTT